jgi:hypothetical protein
MGFLSGLGDFASGLAGSAGSTAMQFLANRRLSDRAFNKSYGAYRRRYQDTTADMRAAGLNPILAASHGFQVGGQPEAHPLGVSGQSISSSARDFSQSSSLRQKVKESKQDIKESIARVLKTREETVKISLEEHRIINETWKIIEDMELVCAKRNLTDATYERVLREVKVLEANLVHLSNIAEVYKTPAGKVMTWVQVILESLGIKNVVGYGFKNLLKR